MNQETKQYFKEIKTRPLYFTLIVFGLLLIFKFCHNPQPTIAVEIPEKSGTFEAVKPEQIVIHDTVFIPNPIRQNLSKKEVEVYERKINELLQENQSMTNNFAQSNDSLQALLYNKVIEVKAFTQTWQNDTLKATATGLVRGSLESIKLDWKINKFSIDVPKQKETYLRLLAGGGFGINKEINQTTYKLNLGFQNKKGNILRGSYQKIGSSEFILAEYDFSILNFKK